MEAVARSYDAKVDAKKRITLRSARFEYYHVKEYQDGSILLEPHPNDRGDAYQKITLSNMEPATS